MEHDTAADQTSLEQFPNELHHEEPRHTHWALIIIVSVVVLFGAFWYVERHQALFHTQLSSSTPIQPPQISNTSMISVDDLQTATANIAIPTFSEQF